MTQPASSLPMTLTLLRMAVGPLVAALVLWGGAEAYLDPPLGGLIFVCAGAVFALAALARWLVRADAPPLAHALSRSADDVLAVCALLALASQSLPLNLVIAAVLLLGRDMAVAGFRQGAAAAGRQLPASRLAAWKGAAQMLAVTALLFEQAALLDHAPDPIYFAAAWTGRAALWAAVALGLVSGYEYAAAALAPGSVKPAEVDQV